MVSFVNVSGTSCLQYSGLFKCFNIFFYRYISCKLILVENNRKKTDAELKSSSLTAIINNLEEHTKNV